MEFLLQLRKRGIQDTRVLRALETVPRERFVEAGQ
ncbi:MAG TPA: protein-L-isoaspartate O-methyltransferase, partial [Xanthobacteraceae bacterium]|nr:protein-L-isoaspartate O-methyltransferase [Xanthobacteraceae bacterium]